MADASGRSPLVGLPMQVHDVAWPTDEWPVAPDDAAPAGLRDLIDEVMAPDGPLAMTLAVLVVHRGRIVAERYREDEDVSAATTLISWSMAKSILHAFAGLLAHDGALDIATAPAVPEWPEGDPRSQITYEHLLTMRDGLDFVEDYVDEQTSDTINMLFGPGADDVAHFAADRPLAHPPGTHFNYSSGTSNIVSRALGDTIGGEDAVRPFLQERLFDRLGMRSATARFDAAGTFVASSYVYATARDFARFGLLYLRDGVWGGERVLPERWVDHARTVRSRDDDTGNLYGAHWWVTDDPFGSFWANGYEGQSILVSPGRDLVVVRLGKTASDRYPLLKDWRARVIGLDWPA